MFVFLVCYLYPDPESTSFKTWIRIHNQEVLKSLDPDPESRSFKAWILKRTTVWESKPNFVEEIVSNFKLFNPSEGAASKDAELQGDEDLSPPNNSFN